MREPRRAALGAAWEMSRGGAWRGSAGGGEAFDREGRRLVERMLSAGCNSPGTHAAPGASSTPWPRSWGSRQVLGLRGAGGDGTGARCGAGAYPLRDGCLPDPTAAGWRRRSEGAMCWATGVRPVVDDLRRVRPSAARFHDTLADAIKRGAGRWGRPRVALSGGCFQNRRLPSAARRARAASAFEVLLTVRCRRTTAASAWGRWRWRPARGGYAATGWRPARDRSGDGVVGWR